MSGIATKDLASGSPSQGHLHGNLEATYSSEKPDQPDQPSVSNCQQQEPPPRNQKKKLLIVEDDHNSAFALRGILKTAYDVEVADTLANARKKLRPDYSWVLLDLMLPDGSGEHLLREIRDGRMPICVCIMTGCGDAQRLIGVNAMKPEVVLTKPIDVDVLLAKLRSH